MTTVQPAKLKHHRGLWILFGTEMWERFGYYLMVGIFLLYLKDPISNGGAGFNLKMATDLVGSYIAMAYLTPFIGGLIADRYLGYRKAIILGGALLAAGYFVLAIPGKTPMYIALLLLVTGNGFFKPNISTLLGNIYNKEELKARKDNAYNIFYMGINIGAALGPLVCSTLGEKMNWHLGFAAAGIGMVLGLVQYSLTRKLLGPAGELRRDAEKLTSTQRTILVGVALALVLLIVASLFGWLRLNPVTLAQSAAGVILTVAVLYFGSIYLFGNLDHTERRRVNVIVILFLSSAIFWAGFEQAGSSFNLFAERFTARALGSFVVPAGWYQSLGPIFVIAFAPVFAALWVRLAARKLDPSLPVKFGIGLILLAVGFAVMAAAAAVTVGGGKATPTWLVTTYLLHTFGELCLSPVGLSSVTKLAPQRFVGQMMGTWFLGSSLGNLLAGILAGRIKMNTDQLAPGDFMNMLWMPLAAGALLILSAPLIKRWIGDVK